MLRSGIVVEELFEGPASVGRIVVAAGLSLVIPIVFTACPGRGAMSLAFDAGSSREFSGEVILATVELATIFLTCAHWAFLSGGGGGGKTVDCFSGEVTGEVRKLVSTAGVSTATRGFSLFTGPVRFAVVGGLEGEVSKDSMTLVSATKTSTGGGSIDLIFITLSSRGFLCNWWEETVTLPCRFKIGGSPVFGGNTAELIGDVGRTPARRIFFFGRGLGLPPLSLGRLLVRPGVEASNRGDSIGEVC